MLSPRDLDWKYGQDLEEEFLFVNARRGQEEYRIINLKVYERFFNKINEDDLKEPIDKKENEIWNKVIEFEEKNTLDTSVDYTLFDQLLTKRICDKDRDRTATYNKKTKKFKFMDSRDFTIIK